MRPTKEQLWAAQVAQYPNSVEQSISQVLRWHEFDLRRTPCTRYEYFDSHEGWFEYANDPEFIREYNHYVQSHRLTNALCTSNSVAVNLANALDHGEPCLFYLCGPGLEDPEREVYRGCRYGLEGHEYMSGWSLILGKDMK